MLSINALGYVARRTLGPRVGLAVAGFCGGFVSSILTIAALGRQARADPALLRSAVAGGSFSSIATAIELLIIIFLTDPKLLPYLGAGITAMGAVAAAYGLAFASAARDPGAPAEPASGRAFEPKFAFIFAGAFALMSLAAALLQQVLGPSGAQATIALGGFVDTHAAAASGCAAGVLRHLGAGPRGARHPAGDHRQHSGEGGGRAGDRRAALCRQALSEPPRNAHCALVAVALRALRRDSLIDRYGYPEPLGDIREA